MKVSISQYAQTLYELTQNKSEGDVDSVVVKFVELLKKNKHLKFADDIVKKFIEVYNKKNGIIEAEIVTVRKLESNQIRKVENFLKEKYSAQKVILKNKIDKNIKGGIIVKASDEVLDGSVSRRLRELSKALKS